MRQFSVLLFALICHQCWAQTLCITDVQYTGLVKTKSKTLDLIIDLDQTRCFPTEDSAKFCRDVEQKIYNTRLFSSVTCQIAHISGDNISLLVTVKERWYTYAIPYFDLIDRNFNEWWVIRNRDLTRIIAGLDITQKNLSGKNDDLSLSLLTGYQQKAHIEYKLPYYIHRAKIGLRAELQYHRYRSVNYITEYNQLQYAQFESPQLIKIGGLVQIDFLSSFSSKKWLSVGLQKHSLKNDALALNPKYFGANVPQLVYGQFGLGWRRDTRDIRGYANSGSLLSAELSNYYFFENIELNFSELIAKAVFHTTIGNRWRAASATGLKLSRDKARPYFLNRSIGWDENRIRIYDYFVIDGSSCMYEKLSLRYLLVEKTLIMKKIPITQFQQIPLKIAPKIFVDGAYIINHQTAFTNNYANTPLLSSGIGLDLVFFDDAVWRFEYGVNQSGKAAFFLNFTSAIQ